jgi:hopanoid biosynthesis associated protein HpnK
LKRLIVTADDFGLTLSVNDAIEDGHRRGILTAASLMVTGEAASDAVTRARTMPGLGVGLHLVLVDGVPVLPPEQIPDLVGTDGRFSSDLFGLGVRIFCRAAARRQVAAEIRAQLAAFRATGLALDHVNAHHHFHLHPTVQTELIRLAPEFGIKAIRVPREPPFAPWRAGGRRFYWLGAGLLEAGRAGALKRRLDAAGISCNDWIFGLADTGAMVPERMLRYLENLPDGISEVYVHPALLRPAEWPESYRCRGEYEALVDPMVGAFLVSQGIKPIPFAGLASAA